MASLQTSPATLPTSSKEIRQNIAIFEAGGQLPTGGKVRKPKGMIDRKSVV